MLAFVFTAAIACFDFDGLIAPWNEIIRCSAHVDLTGFDRLGEHASAAACMDGVVLVGLAHRTREKDVLRFVNEMPESRFLGVLLVG